MQRNIYKNYRVCSCCGTNLPLSRKFFKRINEEDGSTSFHFTCRECEDNTKRNIEWRDGKLLCHCCKEYKDINEFSPNGGTSRVRNNRRAICKDCSTKKQKKYNSELSNDKKLYKCLKWRLLSARDRSKRYGKIKFSLSIEDLIALWNKQEGKCALSGISMTYELQKGRTPTNVSIDRIDTKGDYSPDNIQLVCMACNQIKSDMSEEEMYQFCKQIVTKHEDKIK